MSIRKVEMKKNLNMTRYGVDQAVQELVQVGNLVRIIPNNGKANHFYINDIYENEMEEESMMTLDRIYGKICHWKERENYHGQDGGSIQRYSENYCRYGVSG